MADQQGRSAEPRSIGLARDLAVAAARPSACSFAVWTVGIEARLFYLQVVQHAELKARADRQQLDTIDVPAKRGEILDRHGRVLAYSVDADTIFANPRENDEPERTASLVCGALDKCDAAMRQAHAQGAAEGHAVRLSGAEGDARGGRPRQGARAEGHRLPQGEPPLLPEERARGARARLRRAPTTSAWPASSPPTTRTIRGKDGKVLRARRTPGSTRCSAAWIGRRRRGRALELTIDQYLQHIAERELRAGVEENRAAGGTAVVMDPHTGEILAHGQLADVQSQRVSGVGGADAAQPRRPGSLRAGIDVQAGDRLRGAGGGRRCASQDPIDCAPGYIKFEGRPADPRRAHLRRAAVHRRHRQVEQRRRDQGRTAARAGAPRPLCQPLRVRAADRP